MSLNLIVKTKIVF